MLSFVGRNEPVEVSVEDGVFQPVVIPERLPAELQFVVRQILDDDVEAQFAHHGHVRTELDRSRAVPIRHVCAHAFQREEMGVAPLDENALQRVGVVAGPEFREVAQRPVVGASPAA